MAVPTATPYSLASSSRRPSTFNLQNLNGGSSSASFSVAGITRNVATGETSPFNGLFTAQFTVPYQTLLGTVRGGTITNSYSARFTVTALPEFGSMFIMLGGLADRGRQRTPKARSAQVV